MSKPSQDTQINPVNHATVLAGVVSQVGCVVVMLIGLALGAGMLLDRVLGTSSIFTIVFMVGSVPVTLYLTMRVAMRAAERAQKMIESTTKKSEEEA